MDRNKLLEDLSLRCDCSRLLEFTGRNAGGYDIYYCPACEREGRSKRYRFPEDATNFIEYRDRVDAVYSRINMRRGEKSDWEKDIVDISGQYNFASMDPQFTLLEMACYTNNFADALDLRENYNYVNDRYKGFESIDSKNVFPLNLNGVTMLSSCKRWLEKDVTREDYNKTVRELYNRARSYESRKQSRENFKSDAEKLRKLDTIHNSFTKDDPVYHLAYIIVHTQNFRRRMPIRSKGYLEIKDECNMIRVDLEKRIDPDDKVVLAECERWLAAQELPKWAKIAAIVAPCVLVVTLALLGIFLSNKVEDKATGITVKVPFAASDAFHRWSMSFHASKVEEGSKEYSTAATLLKKESEKFEIYDLTMMSGDKAAELDGSVEVAIPIPEGFFVRSVAVYYISGEGSCQLLDSKIIELNGQSYVSFKTDHFSLYAVAERLYRVSFENRFDNGIPDQVLTWGDRIEEPEVAPQQGYTFEGWYDGATKWNFGTGVVGSDVSLVAKWSPIKCSIYLNDGKEIAEYIATYGEAYDLPTPERLGYTFAGWFDANGKEHDIGVWDGLDSLELTAKWQRNHYSIVFDNNVPTAADNVGYKGSILGNMVVPECEYDEEYTLPKNDFKIQGFVFGGWAVKSNGGAVYGDCETISNLTSDNDATVTLYAVWKVDIYSIGKYVANSTVVSDTDGEATYVVYNSPKDNSAIAHGGKAIVDWSACPSGSYDHYSATGKSLEIAGAEEVYFLGSSSSTYNNLYVYLSNYGENDNLTLHFRSFNMVGRISTEEASKPKALTVHSENDNSIKAINDNFAISGVSELNIVGEGNLTICGGNGSNVSSVSTNGNAGKAAISVDKLTVDFKGKLTLMGGSGGNGADGKSYTTTPNGKGQSSAGYDGSSGTKGTDGGKGGDGGAGAAAIHVDNLYIISVNEMICIGGNGGNGGSGGRGQNGGNGGKGGDTTGQDGRDAGDGGRGGNGGSGGKGGSSGTGAPGIAITNEDDLRSCANLSLVHGYSGNAGNGGDGGNAGDGGDGGDDEHGGGLFGWGEGPEEGIGGDPGTPGTGGSAGAVIKEIIKYNIPGINEIVSENPNVTEAKSGSNGKSGESGDRGDNGFK